MVDFKIQYLKTYDALITHIEKPLETHIIDMLSDLQRIDSIRTRAKEPSRFNSKAKKKNENNIKKYSNPIKQIQDQMGARITVLFLRDIKVVRERMLEYFKHIEIIDKEPSNEEEFSYFGTHLMLKIPDEVIPNDIDKDIILPDFFELQIKTLFQHAWSEANHDLGYKSTRDLDRIEKRKIALSSAQAWGADHIFNELSEKLTKNEDK